MNRLLILCVATALLFSCKGPEATPITRFNVDVASFAETDSDQSISLTFTADAVATEDLAISYELQENTATFDNDFSAQSGTLNIPAGSDKGSIELVIKGDTHLELDESFDLLLYGETTIKYTFTIKDNDSETIILEDAEGYYTPIEYPSMRLVWSDEFEGTSINLDNWTHEVGDEWFNNELQAYSADPLYSSVADGKLSITAREDNGNNQ